MVNMVDFQNTPQNGDTGHDNDKHLAGGQRCSRFVPVHGLFSFCSQTCATLEQNVNKKGTPNGVTKLQHCCKYTTPMVLQDCHSVAQWLCQCNCALNVEIIWESVRACRYNVYCVYVHGISFCYVIL